MISPVSERFHSIAVVWIRSMNGGDLPMMLVSETAYRNGAHTYVGTRMYTKVWEPTSLHECSERNRIDRWEEGATRTQPAPTLYQFILLFLVTEWFIRKVYFRFFFSRFSFYEWINGSPSTTRAPATDEHLLPPRRLMMYEFSACVGSQHFIVAVAVCHIHTCIRFKLYRNFHSMLGMNECAIECVGVDETRHSNAT